MDNKARRILAGAFALGAVVAGILAFLANQRAQDDAFVDRLLGGRGDVDRTSVLILGAVAAVLFVLAVVSLLSSNSTNNSSAPAPSGSANLVKCEYCAELIQPEARVCKHCGRDVTPHSKPPGN